MSILEYLDRPIAFHRCFVTITGSITASLMLSQALYWQKRTQETDEWFFKSREEWTEETGLSRTEQETARAKLKSLDLLQEELRGLPARMYYRANVARLEALLCQQVGGKPANTEAGNLPTGRQKSRQHLKETETTTETTQRDIPPPPSGKPRNPPGQPIELPAWLPQAAWAEFRQHRKEIRSPLTPLAESKAIQKLDELRRQGHDPVKVIDQSIGNGWTGLFPLKSETPQRNPSKPGRDDWMEGAV
ncbi:hypothetical protein [Methylomagnum ishizawai]|uniref:hypothetical protein n=1 Tax=Methylomagnum ishizawai TaxID=1760988 RepID=UPI001C330393|nr:hypothetical protein [Methylomagnum ishizawai]BBL73185.1 hypothetical protein MishRS11D_02830 [Methylomagnum ishizawai]